MKRKTLLKTILLLVFLGVFGVITLVIIGWPSSQYKKYADNESKQVATILKDYGCLDCHSGTASVPVYAKMPFAGSLIKKDMEEGTKYLDLDPLMEALNNDRQVSEVDMAKMENTVLSGSMPPDIYLVMPLHWGKTFGNDEKKILIQWAKNIRTAHYISPTVAPEFANEPLQPLPNEISTNPVKVALGFALYHDTRLSSDNTISCATCHELTTGGVDRLQFSKGVGAQLGGVNAPTVYNAALNLAQFWDGRAADLQAQASGPPLNPVEMGHTSFDDICASLALDKTFTDEFNKIYPDGLTEANVTDAIAEFEKTLLTPSRFDKYLRGDKSALTAEEIEGYKVFKDNKCATCHVGMNIGGQSYEYFGVKGDYFAFRNTGLTDGDNGRYAVTGNASDRHKFKTPTLRNVMVTYPYMHDGTVNTIEEAVQVMAQYQGGKPIPENEVNKMVTFMKSLTGEYNGKLLE